MLDPCWPWAKYAVPLGAKTSLLAAAMRPSAGHGGMQFVPHPRAYVAQPSTAIRGKAWHDCCVPFLALRAFASAGGWCFVACVTLMRRSHPTSLFCPSALPLPPLVDASCHFPCRLLCAPARPTHNNVYGIAPGCCSSFLSCPVAAHECRVPSQLELHITRTSHPKRCKERDAHATRFN